MEPDTLLCPVCKVKPELLSLFLDGYEVQFVCPECKQSSKSVSDSRLAAEDWNKRVDSGLIGAA